MSNGLVFSPQTATPAATSSSSAEVIAGDWFPDVDLANLRAAGRFDGTVTDIRLQESALNAIISVGNDLARWSAAKLAAGYVNLAAVPSPKVGAESRLVVLYRRAVYATVQADLSEAYRDFDATAVGERRADGLTPTIGDHRRNARWAVRDILGLSRSNVDSL